MTVPGITSPTSIFREFRTQWNWTIALTALFLIGLALPNLSLFPTSDGYTIVHTLLEFGAMAISLMVFALAWNLRNLERNSQIMVIGWTSLGVLIVDFAHTLSFPGMPDFGTDNSTQKAITFWLAGRIGAAIGFLILALLPTRHWSPRIWLPGVIVSAAAAIVAVYMGLNHTEWVPEFFVPGQGLTATKRVIEYALSATYAIAALLLVRRARREHSAELAWLAAAAWTLTLAELYFTLYVTVTDVFNLTGHILKVIAYLMVYRAIFVAGVQDPFRQLSRETSLLRSLIDSVPDMISFTDQSGRYLGGNRAFAKRVGVATDALPGRAPSELGIAQRTLEMASEGTVERYDEALVDTKGEVHFYDTLHTPYFSTEGERLGDIEISRDVTGQKKAEDEIHHLALFDQLTGLPNRSNLASEAAVAFTRVSTWGRPHALMYIDIDDFKTINDTVGHRVGDLIIAEAASRITSAVGDGVMVARLGGDEFALLATDTTLSDATELAEAVLRAFHEPFLIEDYDLTISVSVGIGMFPTDGADFDSLSRSADAAMYHAKDQGRNTFRFFSGDLLHQTVQRLQLLSALRRAVPAGQLVVHYQPQHRLDDGAICGVEALVRWEHPDEGLLPPERFIDIAEDSGLILGIGDFVLIRAMTDGVSWLAQGLPPMRIAVNLSAVQFVQADLPAKIAAMLEDTGFPPQLLEVEVTETIALANPEAAAYTIDALHQMGVQVAIDDFGTGYSSMSYLKRFRIDVLKIDRSYITTLGHDPDDEAIVRAIIQVGAALRCHTLAEGVETVDQADFLRANGCELAQGYLFAHPMTAEELVRILQPVRETT